MFKLSSITVMAVMALGVSAQAQTESQVREDSRKQVVEYRMNVVSRTTQAVSYKHRSGATRIDFHHFAHRSRSFEPQGRRRSEGSHARGQQGI